jgi:hypothetical protein
LLLLQQVAVKVESLSGFTNSPLRPHVFRSTGCMLIIFLPHIHLSTFLLVVSEVVFTEIADYIE